MDCGLKGTATCYNTHVLRGPPRTDRYQVCKWIIDIHVIICAKFGSNRFTEYLLS